MKKAIRWIGIPVLLFLFASVPPEEKVKEISRAIRSGEMDVGNEYGMKFGQRWHTIHAQILEMECTDCHLDAYEDNYLYQRKYKMPERDAPGVIKPEVCLQCHREGGPTGTPLYGRKK